MQKQLQHFGEQLLMKVRHLWRQRKNLLVIRLLPLELEVEYWQQTTFAWKEHVELAQESLLSLRTTAAYLLAAQDALRTLLLEKEVEESVNTLLVPADFMVRAEEFSLPVLRPWEVRQAVSWEAANAFPWDAGSCCYAYIMQLQDEENCVLHLWGMELQVFEQLEKLGENLLLNMKVVASLEPERLGMLWYAGEGCACFTKQTQGFLTQPKAQHLLTRVAGAILLLSIACYLGAWAGCYLARQEAAAVENELAQYARWRERQQMSFALEKKIQRLEMLCTQEQKQKKLTAQASADMERLGRLIASGCWLTQITQDKSRLEVQGKALDMQALQTFVDNLQQAGNYKKVELKQSQLQKENAEYSLSLERREGEK